VSAKAATHIPTRWDEQGQAYDATADDAAYGIFELDARRRPVIAQINSSWAVRVRRDELVEFQIDGTHGSAVAGLQLPWRSSACHTPKPVWNPDLPTTEKFRDQWLEVPANAELPNGFRAQWEEFLATSSTGARTASTCCPPPAASSWPRTGLKSSAEGRRIEMEELQA
jgi:hypothetical protein